VPVPGWHRVLALGGVGVGVMGLWGRLVRAKITVGSHFIFRAVLQRPLP